MVMELLIGLTLAGLTVVSARFAGFDRERAFYPVILIVIASYYILFASMGQSSASLLPEMGWAVAFSGVSIAGYKRSMWLVVAGLVAHGIFDFVHAFLVSNPGVPPFWPSFCAGFDVLIAAYLASKLILRKTMEQEAMR